MNKIPMFFMPDLIRKKRDGKRLTHDEIAFFVAAAAGLPGYVDEVETYQITAMLMAIFFQGMEDEETRDLAMAMATTGDMVDLSGINGICVDKHSTGGVGDTTTLILAPLTAACGAKVAKMSGRGLGHTGGTLDKLESIPGMRIALTEAEFISQVQRIGCAVIGQTANIAPADKTLYDLRDVTATVDSVPLIVSSIMSKKLASGSGAIVLDVKTGSGALMHTLDDSITLAQKMVEVGRLAGRRVMAMVTGMEQPLGTHIGNALEVKEAIDILAGSPGDGRLLEVSLRLGTMMLVTGGYAPDEQTARARLNEALASGAGLNKLAEMIAAQGGDARVCGDTSLLPQAARVVPVPATRSGYVTAMNAEAIGSASQRLGAGRAKADDVIDPAVGLVMAVQLGDYIQAGAPLAHLHVNDGRNEAEAARMVAEAIEIRPERVQPPMLIHAIVDEMGEVTRA